MRKQNIILIGMPGAGKSTLGVVLAKALGLQFVDTDLLIQQKTGECLQDTINNKGLGAFLAAEGSVCADLKLEGFVIATGGSAVMSEKGMQNLKQNGTVVFLDVPLGDLKRRLDNIATRGIAMRPGESIDSVYEQRLPLYKKYADITVSVSDVDFEKSLEKLLCKINSAD